MNITWYFCTLLCCSLCVQCVSCCLSVTLSLGWLVCVLVCAGMHVLCFPSVCLSVCLCQSIYLSVWQCLCLSICICLPMSALQTKRHHPDVKVTSLFGQADIGRWRHCSCYVFSLFSFSSLPYAFPLSLILVCLFQPSLLSSLRNSFCIPLLIYFLVIKLQKTIW